MRQRCCPHRRYHTRATEVCSMRQEMKGFALTFTTGMLAVLILGCTAKKQPSKLETTLANMAKDVVIPIEATTLKTPLPASEEVIAQGQQAYMQSCALCHGADGHGRTELGRGMYPPAMDLTSPHVQNWTDAELFWIIQNGVRLTGMPSWASSISETDTWKLAHFVHQLPRLNEQKAASARRAAEAGAKAEADLIKYGKTLYRQEGFCSFRDRKSTRLNSSHGYISYAVFCLKKK